MEYIECEQHGRRGQAYLCQHLTLKSSGKGFFTPNGQVPKVGVAMQGWCQECEDYLLKNGGQWNEETQTFANIYAICEGCFLNIYQQNKI